MSRFDPNPEQCQGCARQRSVKSECYGRARHSKYSTITHPEIPTRKHPHQASAVTVGFFGVSAIPEIREIPGKAAALFEYRAVVAGSPFSKRGAKRWSLSARTPSRPWTTQKFWAARVEPSVVLCLVEPTACSLRRSRDLKITARTFQHAALAYRALNSSR